MKYTKEEIEKAIAGKKNATAKNIRYMANGAELELSQAQLAYIRAMGIEPTMVGRGSMVNISASGLRPVYRGSTKRVYTIEVK